MTALGLEIVEAAVGGDAHTFELTLARPGKIGRRQVPAAALERSASMLAGLPVWAGMDTPAAKRAREGLPRRPSELAGEVLEARWDAARRAVVGRVQFIDRIASLVRRMPGALRLLPDVGVFASRGVVESLDVDRERDGFVLTTGGGPGSLDVHRALLEAARDDSPGGDRMTMTLAEALALPQVKDYIRRVAAGDDGAVIETPAASSPIADALRARGRIGDEHLARMFDGTYERENAARQGARR